MKLELVFDGADVISTSDLWIDVDRVIAYEMYHAMMSASGMNFRSMPSWFKEGTAEYLSGAKERLSQSVRMVGASNLVNMLDSSSGGGGSHFYSSAYAATMFLDAKLRAQGKDMSDLMGTLTPSNNATTPMGNPVPVTGPTLDAALKIIFGASYGEKAFKNDFKTKGVSFINYVITKGGIGSIVEVNGVSGGMLSFGGSQTDAGFIPESGRPVNESNSFKYVWDSSTPIDSIYTNPYYLIDRTITNKGVMTFHRCQLWAKSLGSHANSNV